MVTIGIGAPLLSMVNKHGGGTRQATMTWSTSRQPAYALSPRLQLQYLAQLTVLARPFPEPAGTSPSDSLFS